MQSIVLIRGAGDLASGVALRLFRSAFPVLMLEQEKPLAVRRKVAFAEAVYSGRAEIEGVVATKVDDWQSALQSIEIGQIPLMIDHQSLILASVKPHVLVDARMLKQNVTSQLNATSLLIGLGPGFEVGENCHAVIETQRGHHLGRVFWAGTAAADTGIPGSIAKYKQDRILRSPSDGKLIPHAQIGQQLKSGEIIAEVNAQPVIAPFDGVLRGLIHTSVTLTAGMKIGDLDPRNDPSFVDQVSDKALAIGGGVLEAILSVPDLREVFFID